MLKVIQVKDKRQKMQFIKFPFRLYKNCRNWVPWFISDMLTYMDRNKHPFYEHSDADFFIVEDGGEVVGRIAVLENRRFNDYHGVKQSSFYFLDAVDDGDVFRKLFEVAVDWSERRGLNTIVGPKGFGAFDGYGILVEGFQYRQMMTMMNYNYAYYPSRMEELGFEKEVDFLSFHITAEDFQLPWTLYRLAERIKERFHLRVVSLKSRREVHYWALKLGHSYNETFVNNWEFYPLTDREIEFLADNLKWVVVPELMKLIVHEGSDEVMGFLLGFPDISPAIQRAKGHLYPWNILDMLWSLRRARTISLNGAGVHPRYQKKGGNVLLYTEMERTVRKRGFLDAELTQVAETAVEMQKDLRRLGVNPYKRHRVYRYVFR